MPNKSLRLTTIKDDHTSSIAITTSTVSKLSKPKSLAKCDFGEILKQSLITALSILLCTSRLFHDDSRRSLQFSQMRIEDRGQVDGTDLTNPYTLSLRSIRRLHPDTGTPGEKMVLGTCWIIEAGGGGANNGSIERI